MLGDLAPAQEFTAVLPGHSERFAVRPESRDRAGRVSRSMRRRLPLSGSNYPRGPAVALVRVVRSRCAARADTGEDWDARMVRTSGQPAATRSRPTRSIFSSPADERPAARCAGRWNRKASRSMRAPRASMRSGTLCTPASICAFPSARCRPHQALPRARREPSADTTTAGRPTKADHGELTGRVAALSPLLPLASDGLGGCADGLRIAEIAARAGVRARSSSYSNGTPVGILRSTIA